MDFQQNVQNTHPFLFLGISVEESCSGKRKRISKPAASSSESSSESDDDPDGDELADPTVSTASSYRIPKKGRRLWDSKQIENLRKNFKNIEHIDDGVLAFLSFRDISNNEGKKDKQNRVLTEKLAENYERVRKFPVKVEAGEDLCTERAHDARFLRGYVGNSQELWVQARRKLSIAGLDPISSYETVSIGINGFISGRVWHEVHSPSSKLLSIRMLTEHAMKSAWANPEKGGEVKEFDSMHDLKMAVVALEACIKKVYWWNNSFTTLAIFLHTIGFGFGSAQDVTAKWSALLVRKNGAQVTKTCASSSRKKAEHNSSSKKPREKANFPPGECKLFQKGTCTHTGDKHSAPWNSNFVLKHSCAKYVPAKAGFCLEAHAEKDHK